MGVGGQRHAPTALPPVMSRYPLYGRLKKGDITLYFMRFSASCQFRCALVAPFC